MTDMTLQNKNKNMVFIVCFIVFFWDIQSNNMLPSGIIIVPRHFHST